MRIKQLVGAAIASGLVIGACVGVGQAAAVGGATNLLGPNGSASIQLDEDYTGVIEDGVPTGLDEIYDEGSRSEDDVVMAAEADCTSDNWLWEQILCDQPPTTDAPGILTTEGSGYGATFNNDTDASEWYGYYVIDLGGVRSFTTLEVYQMFSDGKVTQVALSVSPETSDTRPTWNDPGWVEVLAKSDVGEGTEIDQTPYQIADPSVFALGTQTGRYILLKMWNDGSYGDGSYIEVSGVKLFGMPVWGPGSEPPHVMQQVGVPAEGCASVINESLNWGGAPAGGWSQSWAEWPNGGLGGEVCTRSLKWTTTGAWTLVG